MRKEPFKYALLILAFLLVLNGLAFKEVLRIYQERGQVKVIFFDVGQGDSAFIRTAQGHQILIDGGPDSSILNKLAANMPFYDRSLDLIILSHPEKDHLSGFLDVLKRYKVENILWTGVVRNTSEWQEWAKLIKEEGADVEIAQFGQKIILGDNNLYFSVIYPFENMEGKEFSDSNNTSIVLKLVSPKDSFLFTGDIENEAEQELAAKNLDIKADYLKVAHHGSKTSSSEEFIKMVSPKAAIISDAKNNTYGHPNPEVLAALEKFGIEIKRTDEQGDVQFTINN